MVLSQSQGHKMLDRWHRREFLWASWESLGRARSIDDPDEAHLSRVLEIVDVAAIRRHGFKVVLDACHGAGGRLGEALLRSLGCRPLILGGQARRPLRSSARADRGEPERVRPDRAGRRRVGRFRSGPRCRSAGDHRRERPLHWRGANVGAGRPQTAGAAERTGRAQPLDLACDRGSERCGSVARSFARRSARSTSSSEC